MHCECMKSAVIIDMGDLKSIQIWILGKTVIVIRYDSYEYLVVLVYVWTHIEIFGGPGLLHLLYSISVVCFIYLYAMSFLCDM